MGSGVFLVLVLVFCLFVVFILVGVVVRKVLGDVFFLVLIILLIKRLREEYGWR